jgi:glycosyltransferase involved in cell wall biosynthesis
MRFEKKSTYAILIPVLNEGVRIQSQLGKMKPFNRNFDCIVIDGGSTDGSLTENVLEESEVRIVAHSEKGLGRQLRVGFSIALEDGYDGVIVIDGNDKDDVQAIPQFAEALRDGFDHVQGSRFIEGGAAVNTPWIRSLAIRWIHAPMIRRASGFPYTDTTNGFRAYSRHFLEDPRVQPFRDIFSDYELHYYLAIRAAQLNFRIKELPVTRTYPLNQKTPTKISLVRGNLKLLRTLWFATSNRYRPNDPTEYLP